MKPGHLVPCHSITVSLAHPVRSAAWAAGFLPVPSRANFTYFPLSEERKLERRDWILTATEFHTY